MFAETLALPDWRNWQIAVGDLSELIRPTLYLLAAFLSACVLFDTRRRAHALPALVLWTLGTFLLPHIAFPLYLAARIFTPRSQPARTPHAALPTTAIEADDEQRLSQTSHDDAAATLAVHQPPDARQSLGARQSPVAGQSNGDAGMTSTTSVETGDGGDDDGTEASSRETVVRSPESATRPRRFGRALLLPALYFLTLAALGAFFFYRDYASVEAHLARAANAKLLRQSTRAIREYRAALSLEEDAHTRKLLAIALADAGQFQPALDEFLAARRGGETGDALAYRIALTLDALNRTTEALPFYQEFLQSDDCTAHAPDPLCPSAQRRMQEAAGKPAGR